MSMCKYIHIFPFQSTLPREERLISELYGYQDEDFNPRSHERSDGSQGFDVPIDNISIHAPTRGATLQAASTRRIAKFQSTLPREERRKEKSRPV